MHTRLLATACLAIAVGLSHTPDATAGQDAIYTTLWSNTAIQGHDPVAYFTEGKPVKGKADYAMDYQGAEFRFASQENLDLFAANPEKYAPQYGGYCAWAMADGNFARGDADFWHIQDGKLYLNFNRSVQEKWDADRENLITKADAIWPNAFSD